LPSAPQYCRATPTDCVPFFGEQAVEHRVRQRRLQRGPRPGTLIDELAQRLDIGARQPVDQRTDGLPLPIEQQAAHILARVNLPLRPTEQRRQGGEKLPQPSISSAQGDGVHALRYGLLAEFQYLLNLVVPNQDATACPSVSTLHGGNLQLCAVLV